MAVTVVAVEGPSQIMFVPIGDSSAADADRLVELVARTIAVPGALAAMGYRAKITFQKPCRAA